MAFENDGYTLRNLHARLADAAAGYRDGLGRTSSEVVAGYFEAYRSLHDRHMVELAGLMLSEGLKPRRGGVWETLYHTGMMAFDAPVDRLDSRTTGAVTRGERVLADLYDEALDAMTGHPAATALLMRQKAELADPFEGMSLRAA